MYMYTPCLNTVTEFVSFWLYGKRGSVNKCIGYQMWTFFALQFFLNKPVYVPLKELFFYVTPDYTDTSDTYRKPVYVLYTMRRQFKSNKLSAKGIGLIVAQTFP